MPRATTATPVGVGGVTATTPIYNVPTGVNPIQVNQTGAWSQTTPAWNAVNPTMTVNTTVPAMDTSKLDIMGVSTVVPDKNLDVEGLKKMIKQAASLYESNTYSSRPVASEVDTLRARIENETFDANSSKELKNIFGFMIGDLFNSLLSSKRFNDYDEVVDLLLELFPKGSGVAESKYAGDGKTKKKTNYYAELAKDIRAFEVENNLDESLSEDKFNQVFNHFKLANPHRLDLQDASVTVCRKQYLKRYGKR